MPDVLIEGRIVGRLTDGGMDRWTNKRMDDEWINWRQMRRETEGLLTGHTDSMDKRWKNGLYTRILLG